MKNRDLLYTKHLSAVTEDALIKHRESAYNVFAECHVSGVPHSIGVNGFGDFVVIAGDDIFTATMPFIAVNKYREYVLKNLNAQNE